MLVPTPEQEDLRAAVRDLLTDRAGSARLRTVMDGPTGHDPDLWKALTAQLGVVALGVPEEHGGAGGGMADRAIVAEELGRVLAAVPFAGTATALDALAGSAAADEWVPRLVAGEAIGAAALRAEVTADGDRLTGRAPAVVGLALADIVVVAAGDDLWAVRPADARITPLRSYDPTRRVARLDLDGTPAVHLGPAARVRDRAAVGTAAEQVGGILRLVTMTAGYAKARVQFGRPIGSFQGVKHACADMYVAGELAVSVVRHAAWTADEDPAALPAAAATARAFVGPAYFRAAADAVQLHGGIGYTWEHDAHLYYKRAKAQELLDGTPAEHRAALADLIAPADLSHDETGGVGRGPGAV